MPSTLNRLSAHIYPLRFVPFLVILVLSIFAATSVVQGIANALQYSRDFQWSPIVLLWQGMNPYVEVLSGNFSIHLILDQSPGYLHAMYVFLGPFALLDWSSAKIVWAVLNVFAALGVCYFLALRYRLSRIAGIVMTLIFLCSTPFRNSLGNGQVSIFILLCFASLYLHRPLPRSLLAGLVYIKYSFAPPVALYLLFKRGWLYFFWSLIPITFGYGVFWLIVRGNPLEVLMQPLAVTSISSGPGIGDLMSLAAVFLKDAPRYWFIGSYYAIPIFASSLLAYFVVQRVADEGLALAIVALASLVFFRHMGYDYVFLLPVLAYCLSKKRDWSINILLLCILYNWFGLRVLDPFGFSNIVMIPINTFIMLVALGLLIHANNGTIRPDKGFK